jgi:hypothetical protein
MNDNNEFVLQIDDEGNKEWYSSKTSLLSRLDGPAIERANGDRLWYLDGMLHRLDGPAVEIDGKNFWFINDKKIKCKNNDDFLRIIKLKNLL